MENEVIGFGGCTCEEAGEAVAILAKIFAESAKVPYVTDEKEAPTMQVTYKGFTGELVKLERKETLIRADPLVCRGEANVFVYDLSIYDSEKQVTHSFTGVKLEDVRFMGGVVAFGG